MSTSACASVGFPTCLATVLWVELPRRREAGVRAAWVVDPETRTFTRHEGGATDLVGT
ncbi:MAG: hypothetical protein IRY95_05765 [Clostridia bacterium]|nr:hypothetical protein [Clostridia bacterium]